MLQGDGVTACPNLSVIVATYNRRDVLLSASLPSMLDQDLPGDQYEVIVVVDGSTDGTAEALRELHPGCILRVVEQQNQGLSKARNTGIAMAHGDLVMFMDDDIVCRPDVFRRHVEAQRNTEPTVVHGAIYQAPQKRASLLGNANVSWYRNYNDRLAAHGGAIWPEGVFLMSNSSTPRSTLLACGGLDEALLAMDDFEIGLRLWKMGVRFKYLPDAVAYELSAKSSRTFLFKDGAAWGRTEVALCRKYPEYRRRSLLAGLGRTRWLRRIVRRIVLQAPVSPVLLLVPPIWLCEKLCRLPAMQRAGIRLLGFGRRLTELRAALREVGSWQKFHREFALRLPVLLYHHVGPPRSGTYPSLTVAPASFERQVKWVARRGFHGIRPLDWLRWLRDGHGLPEKPVLFTFDDGYADLAEYALPVLCRYGFGAAVYLATARIGETNVWDQAEGSAAHRLMTIEQVQDWAQRGIEFGAHTRTHVDLSSLPPDQLTNEVVGSADDLERLLGVRPASFAYPYGRHSPQVVECVRDTYDLAFDIDARKPGMNHLLSDPHLLQRSMVQPVDLVIDVAFRVLRGYSPLQGLRVRFRLRSRFKHLMRLISGRS